MDDLNDLFGDPSGVNSLLKDTPYAKISGPDDHQNSSSLLNDSVKDSEDFVTLDTEEVMKNLNLNLNNASNAATTTTSTLTGGKRPAPSDLEDSDSKRVKINDSNNTNTNAIDNDFLSAFGADLNSANDLGGPNDMGTLNLNSSYSSSSSSGNIIPNSNPNPDTSLESMALIAATNQPQRPDHVFPKVHNCVGSFYMKCDIDLKDAVVKARNAEYNPKKVCSALVMRTRAPKSTCLVYESGRVMITGAQSPEDCKLAGKQVAKMFQVMYPEKGVKFASYTIENMISISDFQFPIRLEGLAYDYRQSCSYEPEIFSGLVWRMTDPKLSLLIFVSGKVVITGARRLEDMYRALDLIYPKIHDYQK